MSLMHRYSRPLELVKLKKMQKNLTDKIWRSQVIIKLCYFTQRIHVKSHTNPKYLINKPTFTNKSDTYQQWHYLCLIF